MVSPYVSLTTSDRERMLKVIGVSSVEDLLKGIPERFRMKRPLALPKALSEFEVQEQFSEMLGTEAAAMRRRVFLGAGVYDHFIASAANHMTLRGEFLTAYTPYQPEISQGTLQVIFEFQTMMASLMGMDLATASHYDGAAALADGALMALRLGKKINRLIVAPTLHPDWAATLRTYVSAQPCEITTAVMDEATGMIDAKWLAAETARMDDASFGLVLQTPNYLGVVEPVEQLTAIVKQKNGMVITATPEMLALAMLKPPGECGVDIAVGEGQPLGLGMSYGGPLLGVFTTRTAYMRQVPGRLCGLTKDANGVESFVLTLSTREQHIRREKATSNICSNQNLCSTAVAVNLALLGHKGLTSMAQQNINLSTWLKTEAAKIKGVKIPYSGPTFNEFVVRLPKAAADVARVALERDKTVIGVPLGAHAPQDLLVAVTETKTSDDLNHWLKCVTRALG